MGRRRGVQGSLGAATKGTTGQIQRAICVRAHKDIARESIVEVWPCGVCQTRSRRYLRWGSRTFGLPLG